MSDTFELVPESEISNAKEIEIGDKAMGHFSMLYSYAIRAMEDSDLSNAYVMKMPDNLSDLPDFHLMTYDD